MTVLEKQQKRWTYEEYCRLDEDQRYEIIEGTLLMAPAPDVPHQSWLGALYRILDDHVRPRRRGKVFVSPVDVVLNPENTVQPDLVFIATANLGIIQQRGIFGTPDLVVELLSASSVRRDRYDKKELYARFGIKEYWIGDPANKTLEVFVLQDGQYRSHCSAGVKGKLSSVLLPELVFDLTQIWSD